jgi:S-adenosylmethionine-diacylgycerolhomoserine-N-methlytransferase
MAPSTSPASPSLEEARDAARALRALERFYGWHAPIYDLTRPFLLFGRGRAVRALAPGPGMLALDVGCGTGGSLGPLAAAGARVAGIECSSPMRRRSAVRAARVPGGRVLLDPRPYGTHADYEGTADRILFSYSLSMIPPFLDVLDRARLDLRPAGRIAVVDFLDAVTPVAAALSASHVFLGPARLLALRRLFPRHRVSVRSVGLWRFFLFVGEAAVGQGASAARSSRG